MTAAITVGQDRPCITCRHHVSEAHLGRPVDTCSNKFVRWDFVAGQPMLDNARCDEARAAGGRCGERGEYWEKKPQ